MSSYTGGEKRVNGWIDHRLAPDPRWRGCHILRIEYAKKWPRCPQCNQDIRTDADLAYSMFCEAKLYWDNREITHDELRQILLQNQDLPIDSKNQFRSPESYGLDPFREWGRRELGRDIVLVDLDIAIRRYGPRFGLDSDGDLMLVEKKETWPCEREEMCYDNLFYEEAVWEK